MNTTPDPVSAANARQSAFYATHDRTNPNEDTTALAGYTPSTDRVRNLFAWAYAWRTEDDPASGDTDLSSNRESQRAEFDRWLAAHDAEMLERAHAAQQPNRETLIEAVAPGVCQSGGHIPNRDRSLPGSCESHRSMAAGYVDAVVAALPIPATGEVTTIEELDAMPNGSVIKDTGGKVNLKGVSGGWLSSHYIGAAKYPDMTNAPFTVLHRPEITP